MSLRDFGERGCEDPRRPDGKAAMKALEVSALQEPVPREPAAGSWRGGGCGQRAEPWLSS